MVQKTLQFCYSSSLVLVIFFCNNIYHTHSSLQLLQSNEKNPHEVNILSFQIQAYLLTLCCFCQIYLYKYQQRSLVVVCLLISFVDFHMVFANHASLSLTQLHVLFVYTLLITYNKKALNSTTVVKMIKINCTRYLLFAETKISLEFLSEKLTRFPSTYISFLTVKLFYNI